jgi:uncharacterized protein YecE (DUF72 family)
MGDGVLYPPGTPPRDRLAQFVRHFDTVKLNASFYRWPRPAMFAGWRQRLPESFQLSVKAPRGLTHAFVYVRLHGPNPTHLYAGSYPNDDLSWWADRIREWAGQCKDVYAYFNNDGDGNAVRDAWTLRRLLNDQR